MGGDARRSEDVTFEEQIAIEEAIRPHFTLMPLGMVSREQNGLPVELARLFHYRFRLFS